MCETREIAFVATCVRSSHKMPGQIPSRDSSLIDHKHAKPVCVSSCSSPFTVRV